MKDIFFSSVSGGEKTQQLFVTNYLCVRLMYIVCMFICAYKDVVSVHIM